MAGLVGCTVLCNRHTGAHLNHYTIDFYCHLLNEIHSRRAIVVLLLLIEDWSVNPSSQITKFDTPGKRKSGKNEIFIKNLARK